MISEGRIVWLNPRDVGTRREQKGGELGWGGECSPTPDEDISVKGNDITCREVVEREG